MSDEVDDVIADTIQLVRWFEGWVSRRAGEGNPNHKGSGPGGGQFTSGPGGGSAAGKPHGKHWAARQRRKKRQGRKPRKKGADGKPLSRKSAHSQTAKEKADRLKKGKPAEYASEKARRAAEHQNKTDGKIQQYTKNNEHVFAKRVGGKSFPDNDPVDVQLQIGGKTHGIELKTITHGKNDKLTMKRSAIDFKVAWEKEHKTQMHTVALDHRNIIPDAPTPHLASGHEIYYKRGVGSFRIGQMHKVANEAELKKLMATPYDDLPAMAKGPIRGTKH